MHTETHSPDHVKASALEKSRLRGTKSAGNLDLSFSMFPSVTSANPSCSAPFQGLSIVPAAMPRLCDDQEALRAMRDVGAHEDDVASLDTAQAESRVNNPCVDTQLRNCGLAQESVFQAGLVPRSNVRFFLFPASPTSWPPQQSSRRLLQSQWRVNIKKLQKHSVAQTEGYS